MQGAAGAVGACAVHLARRRGATVVASVRKPEQRESARRTGANEVVLAGDGLEARLRALAPGGVDHVVEVAFDANLEIDLAVLRNGGSIATYATHSPRPEIPFWPLVFDNVRIDFLGSDDFPPEAKARAARELSASLAEGWRPFRTFEQFAFSITTVTCRLKANLRNADLSGADLVKLQLDNADLSGADLSDADLANANLSDADLTKANLHCARFLRARLNDADLRGANLRGVDLRGAILLGADLSDAILLGADLSGAHLENAIGDLPLGSR